MLSHILSLKRVNRPGKRENVFLRGNKKCLHYGFDNVAYAELRLLLLS